MPDDNQTPNFCHWLKAELNSVAEACASYVRTSGEGVPEDASTVHSVLLEAWDAYNILVLLDFKYKPSDALTQFMQMNEQISDSSFESRIELLDRYYEQRSEVDLDAPENMQARGLLMADVRRVFNVTGDGEMIRDIFAQAFQDGDYEEDDLLDDEPAAVVYVYEEAWAARAAHNGDQPPFDRADEVILMRWQPLDENEREIIRDIIETQRDGDGHLEMHLEAIMEKMR